MSTKIVRIVVWGSVAVAVVVVLYIRYTPTQVNRLIDEANDMIDEGDAKQKELGEGMQLSCSRTRSRKIFSLRSPTRSPARRRRHP